MSNDSSTHNEPRDKQLLPTTVRVVVLLLLGGLVAQATAQNPRGAERSSACLPSASRAKESCEPTKVVVHSENEAKFSLELPSPTTAQCAVTIEVEYTQRAAMVRVAGTIENKDCAASNGEYKLAVRIRDENRELKTLEFFESWQRQDDQSVEFGGDYPIGENVDLVGVRPIQLRCMCIDTPGE